MDTAPTILPNGSANSLAQPDSAFRTASMEWKNVQKSKNKNKNIKKTTDGNRTRIYAGEPMCKIAEWRRTWPPGNACDASQNTTKPLTTTSIVPFYQSPCSNTTKKLSMQTRRLSANTQLLPCLVQDLVEISWPTRVHAN
jgi:hypothetical protein